MDRDTLVDRRENQALLVALIGAFVTAIYFAIAEDDAGLIKRFFIFVIFFLISGVFFLAAGMGIVKLFYGDPLEEQRAAAAQPARPKPEDEGWTSLRSWRGFVYMTKDPVIDAMCTRCDSEWEIEGKVANTIADSQNLANRMVRGGTKMEQFGATFTVGASGRRIAAGNESARQQQELTAVLSLASCPLRHGIDAVYLRKKQ